MNAGFGAPPRIPLIAALIGALGVVLLALWGAAAPRAVLQGWLIAFATATSLPFGALALLCIGRLTGGRWAAAVRPLLLRAVAAMPFFCVAFLPLILGPSLIFSWARDADAAGRDVAQYYLNSDFFALRGAIALVGLSFVAALFLLDRGGRLLAALGLIGFAIAVDFTAIDWMLSLAPRFASSSFGAEIAVQNILAVLAFAMLAGAADRTPRDLAGLNLAVVLGVLYMEIMSLIVNWYGDQPDRAAWYLDRIAGVWLWVAFGALFFGAIAPIIALLLTRVRQSPALLRPVGGSILLGVILHDLWLMSPSASTGAAPAALLALATIAAWALVGSSWLRAQLAVGAFNGE